MAIRLILVCKEGPSRNAYLREAMSLGIEVDVVPSFAQLIDAMLKTAYQGILVDVVTSLKANREEKGISQEILGAFPLMQLTWDQQGNRIQSLSNGTSSSGTLAHFVAYDCQPFKPRTIRADARKCVNLNIEIYKDQNLSPANMERSVTVNISKSGCFLCSFGNWAGIPEIWLVMNELEDKTPLSGQILWRQPWGKSMTFPGFGVRFTRISAKQQDQLAEEFHI